MGGVRIKERGCSGVEGGRKKSIWYYLATRDKTKELRERR